MEAALYTQIRRVEAQHWWYVGRRSIVFDWVASTASRFDSPRILDLGCGTGFNLQHLHALGFNRVTGLDVAPEAIDFCRGRGFSRLVRADGARLPFQSGSFELVLALDLIEHIADDGSALAEIARVLTPGGAADPASCQLPVRRVVARDWCALLMARAITADLIALLRCPATGRPLHWQDGQLAVDDGPSYKVTGTGIPLLANGVMSSDGSIQ